MNLVSQLQDRSRFYWCDVYLPSATFFSHLPRTSVFFKPVKSAISKHWLSYCSHLQLFVVNFWWLSLYNVWFCFVPRVVWDTLQHHSKQENVLCPLHNSSKGKCLFFYPRITCWFKTLWKRKLNAHVQYYSVDALSIISIHPRFFAVYQTFTQYQRATHYLRVIIFRVVDVNK